MKYIRGFDGLRAVSIVMVIYTHLGFMDNIADPVLSLRLPMICSGDTGVKIFFVLSGFLISRILLKEKMTTGSISFSNFYIRRLIRLLPPLLIFYAAIIVMMGLGYIQAQWIGFTLSVFYLYNFVPTKYYSGELGPMWSLGVEEQFYLFWPVVIAFYRKYIPSVVAVIIVLCILTSIILPGIEIPYHGKIIPLDTYSFLNRWFLPAVAPIMFGALFSYLLIRHEQVWKFYFFKKHFLLFVAMLVFFLPAYAPVTLFRFPYGLQLLQMAGIAVLLTWIFFNQNSLLTRCLEWKPVAYIGKISYGLYVYHGLFIRTGHGPLYMQQYPLNVFFTTGTAVLSYEFYEKKILKWKKRFSSAPLRVAHLESKTV